MADYAGCLAQAVFRCIAAGADDVAGLLEGVEPCARCLFMVWALQVRSLTSCAA